MTARMSSAAPVQLYRRPDIVRYRVKGAPFQSGEWVRITQIIEQGVFADDEEAKVYTDLVGRKGLVHYLDYSPTVGQVYPGSPMVIVRLLAGGVTDGFWPEELEAA